MFSKRPEWAFSHVLGGSLWGVKCKLVCLTWNRNAENLERFLLPFVDLPLPGGWLYMRERASTNRAHLVKKLFEDE